MYVLNFLLVYYTFIHFCTYMFVCDYNVSRSIESLCLIISNTYSESAKYDENQQTKKSAFKHPLNQVYFMFTTILHHITRAASSNLPLYKIKAAAIL